MELAPPSPALARAEGRFNHYGQSTFYVAQTEQAALVETLDVAAGEGFGWVQEFRFPNLDDILDLRYSLSTAGDSTISVLALGLINEHLPALRPSAESAWKPEYFVPRFIADCARRRGFRGVIFDGTKHYKKNLVLFNWDDLNIETIGEPRLIQLASTHSASGEIDLHGAF
jgi:hypothetical protein